MAVVVIGSGPVGASVARRVRDRAPDADVLVVEAGPVVTRPAGAHFANARAVASSLPEMKALAQGPVRDTVAIEPTVRDRLAASEPGGNPSRLRRAGLFGLGDLAGAPEAARDAPALVMTQAVGGMGTLWTGSCPRPAASEIPPPVRDGFDAYLDEATWLLRASTGAPGALMDEVRERLAALFDEPGARPVQFLPLAIERRPDGPYRTGSDVIIGEDPGIRLLPGHLCTGLVHERGAVTGCVLRELATGHRFTAPAEAVAVCADAVRTPQLLHASGIRPPLLGCYLNDHLAMLGAVDVEAPDAGADDLTAVWVPYDGAVRRHQVLVMRPGVMPTNLAIGPEAGTRLGVFAMAPKQQHVDDRLVFDEYRVDAYGLPLVSVRYRLTDRDRAHADDMRRSLLAVGDALGRIVERSDLRLMPVGSSGHYQGTFRMGYHAADSVVDADGRVWGLDNLYLGGNGILPTETAGNPTLTSVAIALRTADRIAERLTRRGRAA